MYISKSNLGAFTAYYTEREREREREIAKKNCICVMAFFSIPLFMRNAIYTTFS